MLSVSTGAGAELPGGFEAPLRVGLETSPVMVGAGDFNGDGRLDLVATDGAGKVSVLLQSGRSRNEWLKQPAISVGTVTFFARAGDFDDDGDDDLVAADPGTSAWYLEGLGDGTFKAGRRISGSDRARWVAAADWNGDGKLDLASANFRNMTCSVYRGDGDGTGAFCRNPS